MPGLGMGALGRHFGMAKTSAALALDSRSAEQRADFLAVGPYEYGRAFAYGLFAGFMLLVGAPLVALPGVLRMGQAKAT